MDSVEQGRESAAGVTAEFSRRHYQVCKRLAASASPGFLERGRISKNPGSGIAALEKEDLWFVVNRRAIHVCDAELRASRFANGTGRCPSEPVRVSISEFGCVSLCEGPAGLAMGIFQLPGSLLV
jgi:hypothetical protein